MNTTNNGIIYNLDGVPVIDINACEFLIDFDFYQKNILKAFLDGGYSVKGLAYTGVSAERMKILYDAASNDQFHQVTDLDIWKTVHTDFNDVQFEMAVQALYLSNKIVVADINNAHMLSIEKLMTIIEAAEEEIDISSQLNSGVDFDEIRTHVDKDIKRKKKYRKIRDFIEDIID